jgi:ribonuclease J
VPFLLREVNVPIFCLQLTRGLVQVKLKEHRLLDGAEVNVVEPGTVIDVGAVLGRVLLGLALDPGLRRPDHRHAARADRAHGRLQARPHPDHGPAHGPRRLATVGEEGALLLCADSTYVEIEGHTPSEQRVAETLDRMIGDAEGRVIVTTFASLISRVQACWTRLRSTGGVSS